MRCSAVFAGDRTRPSAAWTRSKNGRVPLCLQAIGHARRRVDKVEEWACSVVFAGDRTRRGAAWTRSRNGRVPLCLQTIGQGAVFATIFASDLVRRSCFRGVEESQIASLVYKKLSPLYHR
jgi:hypothetical protein